MAIKLVRTTLEELVNNLQITMNNHPKFGEAEVLTIGTTSDGDFSFILKSAIDGTEVRLNIPYMNIKKVED